MATNLYQTLDISPQASTEEIRKAYKKKALKTHPDRLAQGSTLEDKANAEEQFRQVNNAYEVLSDPEKRRVFDLHGVYPAPTTAEQPSRSRQHAGDAGTHQPRKRRAHSRHRPAHEHRFRDFDDPFPAFPFVPFSYTPFSDPFKVFDDFFREFDNDPFFSHSSNSFRSGHHMGRNNHSVFNSNPFMSPLSSSLGMNPMGLMNSMSMMEALMDQPHNSNTYRSSSSFVQGDANGKWQSEAKTSVTTPNGTETITKRRDWNGNEHVTKTYPDGRQSYRINGVKQALPSSGGHTSNGNVNQGYLPGPPAAASSNSPWGSNLATGGSRSFEHHGHHHVSHHRGHSVPSGYVAPPPSYSASDAARGYETERNARRRHRYQ